jgi:hypothetical protein
MIINFESTLGGARLYCRAHLIEDSGKLVVDWIKTSLGIFCGSLDITDLAEWNEAESIFTGVFGRLCHEALLRVPSVVKPATPQQPEQVSA